MVQVVKQNLHAEEDHHAGGGGLENLIGLVKWHILQRFGAYQPSQQLVPCPDLVNWKYGELKYFLYLQS